MRKTLRCAAMRQHMKFFTVVMIAGMVVLPTGAFANTHEINVIQNDQCDYLEIDCLPGDVVNQRPVMQRHTVASGTSAQSYGVIQDDSCDDLAKPECRINKVSSIEIWECDDLEVTDCDGPWGNLRAGKVKSFDESIQLAKTTGSCSANVVYDPQTGRPIINTGCSITW